jgi:hypothetical protein
MPLWFHCFFGCTNWNLSFVQAEAKEVNTPVGSTSKYDRGNVNGQPTVPDSVHSIASNSELGAEDGDEDGEESPTANLSIGKKLWILFTT